MGTSRLVTNFNLSAQLSDEDIDSVPISEAGRLSLKQFYRSGPTLEGWSEDKAGRILANTSYPDFLRKYGGLTEDAVQLFDKEEHGSLGAGNARDISRRGPLGRLSWRAPIWRGVEPGQRRLPSCNVARWQRKFSPLNGR